MAQKVGPRVDRISWDECFMRIANVMAERSKDPSTQAGAVVVNSDNVIVGAGYNGFPRGIEDEDGLPYEREGGFVDTKYAYVCHAEENAIYNAGAPTKNGRIYCTLFPCNECAKTIIQNGIKEVIYDSNKYADEPAWVVSRKLFKAAGVKTRQYTAKGK
ncbi:MAG: deoxycytidylate deaminase [Candidatus Nanosyncoccaceae bacterium]|jgi:dCMP deaminase